MYEDNDWEAEAKSNRVIQEQFLTKKTDRQTEKQIMEGSNKSEQEDRLPTMPMPRTNKNEGTQGNTILAWVSKMSEEVVSNQT